MAVSERDRSTLGTYIPKYKEAMKPITVKVRSEVAERLKTIENKQEFIRKAIDKALAELNH